MTLQEYINTNDRYGAENGMQLTHIEEGKACAEMTVEHRHLNAGNVCQGGALFTLADVALAAVMNSHKMMTFGIENTISFLQSAKVGDHLVAEALEIHNHHKIPYCEVKITNQNGELIASITALAYRKNYEMSYDGLM